MRLWGQGQEKTRGEVSEVVFVEDGDQGWTSCRVVGTYRYTFSHLLYPRLQTTKRGLPPTNIDRELLGSPPFHPTRQKFSPVCNTLTHEPRPEIITEKQ